MDSRALPSSHPSHHCVPWALGLLQEQASTKLTADPGLVRQV